MINLLYLVTELLSDNWKLLTGFHLRPPSNIQRDEIHLKATMEWLKRAVENGRGGVSSHYSVLKGKWLDPFPETTGYIIPTFFDYAEFSGESFYSEVAVKLCNWLVEVQLDNGACMKGSYNEQRGKNKPIIFNTGQNIFGFLRAFKETGDKKYLGAARRAGDFLVGSTDEQGIWNRKLHHGIPHTYNSRTAWALLDLHEMTGNGGYKRVAVANLDWVFGQQQENGWFNHANFKPGELPNTHGIAYTLRGLLESYLILKKDDYLGAVLLSAEKLFRLFEIKKTLYTFWDEEWKNHGKYFHFLRGRYLCLTGLAQMAIVWMKLSEITGDLRYTNAAFEAVDRIKSLQNLKSKLDGVRGGIKGSFPINGSYSVLKFPNWAAKFFADALMEKMKGKR